MRTAWSGLDVVQFGVGIARKGWLTKDDVLNTQPLARVSSWLRSLAVDVEKNKFIEKLLPLLRRHWPHPRCEVNHKNALQLMVGVILSAQSTDKTVNELTPALFKKFPTAQAFADADPLEIEKMVYRAGFFRAKTRKHHGRLPDDRGSISWRSAEDDG